MTTREAASGALLQRYAELPLPADPSALAALCAATVEALLDTENRVRHLQSRLLLTRRIGIVLGFIMATYQVDEAQAERLLRDKGKGLSRNVRMLAERIIGLTPALETH
jgi:hypothetical protein